jgi:D-alanyl-D-alanine carboxypeptidase
VTVPDPHDSSIAHAPLTRRALREARERDAAARSDSHTGPTAHPPIFKAPPPPAGSGPTHLPPLMVPPVIPLIARDGGPRLAPRHARRVEPSRIGARITMAAASVLALAIGSTSATLALTGDSAPKTTSAAVQVAPTQTAELPLRAVVVGPDGVAAQSPTVTGGTDGEFSMRVAPASVELCDLPAFTTALAAGDDNAAIRAAGGAEKFRTAVATGQAPCVATDDPAHVWAVVDKKQALDPIDYAPARRSKPAGVRSLDGAGLRSDASAALSRLVAAAKHAGVGEIAMNSGYRSYKTQHSNYGVQVTERGTKGADLVSARPGYSEHQTGLATDVVACDGGRCGTLDELAGTPQGDWIVAHAWQYGWVVRYEKGQTDVTGYSPEPWHLRYIGTDLARAYHAGGFHTLEEFLGLPAAPDYAH